MSLSYATIVTDGSPRARGQRLPTGEPIISSPVTSTLIQGTRDAVLVDPPLTISQTERVVDWLKASGKRLTHIYATHGHGDHWFGTSEVLKAFPDAVVYAAPGTIEVMRQQATTGREQLWDLDFPGQIPDTTIHAVPVPATGFELEGEALQAVEVGHSDTDNTTVLHVPSIGLVVAGDVVYNGVHQYLLEGGNDGLRQWLTAIDKVAALAPRTVVAGHKNRELPDTPSILDATRRYLEDVIRILGTHPTARDLYDQMLALHPDRLNPGPLWYGALGLLGE
ncbi:MBL fold metallo-hydrolase [Actinocrispum sp. NPDC049592]|uniref:MBL fold metallo-hydrolase n=1 Tax=Actinocrispum sp. NPDC049592 TaxID=3154835 RepID=UPI003444F5D5